MLVVIAAASIIQWNFMLASVPLPHCA
jgi:hypothetical protein